LIGWHSFTNAIAVAMFGNRKPLRSRSNLSPSKTIRQLPFPACCRCRLLAAVCLPAD
jgi:hypothetical protein